MNILMMQKEAKIKMERNVLITPSKSLYYGLWAGEKIELDKAWYDIKKRG
jgi:hypothetical protein